MADYTAKLKELLRANQCRFERQGKGDHERVPLKIQSSPKCKARKKFRSAAYVQYVSKKFFP
jgi:hypothetical protein